MSIEEGTPRKWSLIATHPNRFGAIAELYATAGEANAREVALKLLGYTVDVTLSKLRHKMANGLAIWDMPG